MPDNAMGWLDRVVDFNFGSQWFMLETASNNEVITSVDFPDMSGGTPGFAMVDTTTPSSYPNGPFTISPANLQGRLTTLAGQGLIGFGERHDQLFPSDLAYVRVWLKFTQALPSSTFRVRFRCRAEVLEVASVRVRAQTVARGRMRAGLSTSAVPFGSVAGDLVLIGSTGVTVVTDFRIDPVSLRVTGPF